MRCFLIIFLFAQNCTSNYKQVEENTASSQKNTATSERILINEEVQDSDKTFLIEKQIFEENEAVFFDGYIRSTAVDNNERLYMVVQEPGAVAIHVFNPDGSFLTTIGRVGRGPGEFEAISSISIDNGLLYVFGSRLHKISVFSLSDYSLIKEKKISKNAIGNKRIKKIYARNGRLYVSIWPRYIMSAEKTISYAILDLNTGNISSPIIEVEKFTYLYYPENLSENKIRYPFTAPYLRHSIVQISSDESLYSVWTEDFVIKKFNNYGMKQNEYYYPFKKTELNLSELPITSNKKKVIKDTEVPESWPAINDFIIDDEHNFWVSTITESDTTFLWWVFDVKGKVLKKFNHKGNKMDRSLNNDSPVFIKKGHFYKHETDIKKGIDRIVKYEILNGNDIEVSKEKLVE